jgi:hypothetical protein
MMAASFIDMFRARAEPGFLWRDVKAGAGAVALTAVGIAAASSSEGAGNQIVSYLTIAGGLVWLAYVARRYLARRQFATSPVGLALAALGGVDAAKAEVDRDFAGRALDGSPLMVGSRFLCFAARGQAVILPLDQVLWAYHEVVRHSVNMIPTGRSHQLVLWKRNGEADVLPLTLRDVDSCVKKLAAAAPWLPIGYSDVLKESWNADRREFIAMVDARRASATAKP